MVCTQYHELTQKTIFVKQVFYSDGAQKTKKSHERSRQESNRSHSYQRTDNIPINKTYGQVDLGKRLNCSIKYDSCK